MDLFAERMECDKNHAYKPNSVNVYFENTLAGSVHLADVKQTIKGITGNKKWVHRHAQR